MTANSQSNERLTTTETRSMSQSEVNSSSIVTNSTTTTKKETFKSERITTPKEEEDDWYDSMHLLLEQDLRPVSPFASQQSEEIYEELKMLANEFLKSQTESALVTKLLEEKYAKMDPEQRQERLAIRRQMPEKESLLQLKNNLKLQLQLIRSNTRPPPIVPTDQCAPNQSPNNMANINNSTTQGMSIHSTEDGWCLVTKTGPQS